MRVGEVAGLPAAHERGQPDRFRDSCEADEHVDDAGDGVRLAEVEAAADRRDEVELRQSYEAPVEAADDEQRHGGEVELLHESLLSRVCPTIVRDHSCCTATMSRFCPSLWYGHGVYRIGELSRRTGASTDLLRAWERRYGLLRPERTAGGFRV